MDAEVYYRLIGEDNYFKYRDILQTEVAKGKQLFDIENNKMIARLVFPEKSQAKTVLEALNDQGINDGKIARDKRQGGNPRAAIIELPMASFKKLLVKSKVIYDKHQLISPVICQLFDEHHDRDLEIAKSNMMDEGGPLLEHHPADDPILIKHFNFRQLANKVDFKLKPSDDGQASVNEQASSKEQTSLHRRFSTFR